MNEATRRLNPQIFGREAAESAIRQLAGIGPEQGTLIPDEPAPDRSAVDRLLAGKPMRTNYRNDGRGFQKEIETTCGAYQSKRTATIRKVDPPTRLIGGGEKRRVIFLANPFLDFAGSWTARHGRALFFEAKSTATHRLKLGDGGLTSTQISSLRLWRNACAAAFVLWQWQSKVALLLPELVCAAADRGEKSITFESGLPVPRGEGSIIWDFLPVLERAVFNTAKRDQANNAARADHISH